LATFLTARLATFLVAFLTFFVADFFFATIRWDNYNLSTLPVNLFVMLVVSLLEYLFP
jgi:hypothetical protein